MLSYMLACHVILCPSCATPVLCSLIENHRCKKITDCTSAMGFHWTCHSSAIWKRNESRKYLMQLNEWANSGASRWVVAPFSVKGVANNSKLPPYKRIIKSMGWEPVSLCFYFFKRGQGVHGGICGQHIHFWWTCPIFNPNSHPHSERACGSQWHPADVRPGRFGKLLVSLPSNYHGSCRLKPNEALTGCFLLHIQHVAWGIMVNLASGAVTSAISMTYYNRWCQTNIHPLQILQSATEWILLSELPKGAPSSILSTFCLARRTSLLR